MPLLDIEKQLKSRDGDLFAIYQVIQKRLLENVQTRWCSQWPEGNDHGPKHIERVLANLDALVLGGRGKGALKLTSRELFLSMLAVVGHDIGMIRGRDQHAEASAVILDGLSKNNLLLFDEHSVEVLKVAIRCHSSSVDLGKACERFLNVEPFAGENVRVRLVASLVRLADELDEDHRRAEGWLQDLSQIPERSRPYWEFCQRIQGIHIGRPGDEITFHISFKPEDSGRIIKEGSRNVSFVRFFAEKIAKINREREKMNPFLEGFARRAIVASIKPLPPRQRPVSFDFRDGSCVDLAAEAKIADDFVQEFPELLLDRVTEWSADAEDALQKGDVNRARQNLDRSEQLFAELPPQLKLQVRRCAIFVEALALASIEKSDRKTAATRFVQSFHQWATTGMAGAWKVVGQSAHEQISQLPNDTRLTELIDEFRFELAPALPPDLQPALSSNNRGAFAPPSDEAETTATGTERNWSCPVQERLRDAMLSHKRGARLRVDLDELMPNWTVRDQGQRGSVVSFAMTACREFLAFASTGTRIDLSEEFLWWAIKNHTGDPNPSQDGARLSLAAIAMDRVGTCLASEQAYRTTWTPQETEMPSDALLFSASRFRVAPAYFAAGGSSSDVYELLQTLRRPVALTVPVFADRESSNGASNWVHAMALHDGTVLDPPQSAIVVGGHAVCVTGFQPDEREKGGGWFVFRNSWGQQWSRHGEKRRVGYGRISSAYLDQFAWEICAL